jgi:lipopolysaccharide/colanic/teichoic acid biosynthesis glycosyltransferase
MDASFMPQKQTAGKKYKHFTISSQQEDKTGLDGGIEFFYVGKNRLKINLLIDTFGAGYAVDSALKAMSVLTRIAATTTIPDILIIDQAIGDESLTELIQFTQDSKIFSVIPLVLDVPGSEKNNVGQYRGLRAVDEIFFLDESTGEKLKVKVAFLKKLKRPLLHHNTRENSSWSGHKYLESKNLVKRSFDIVVAIFLIIILSPLFLLIAVAIKLESRGPVLYVSKRAGRGYQVFNFYKFRTMVVDADKAVQHLSHLNHYTDHDENGSVFFKVINDSRITRVGVFLRNSSMDELPQFFNVLLGNMSFVGNRPLPLYEAAKLTTNDWAERFMAPAGITGLWQVKKREQACMTMEERINLDIAYSKKYNFMYDLWIMANTPSALIQKSNT